MDSLPASLGALRLPPGSEIVTDADEEVFILYSLLQGNHQSSSDGNFRGLGHVDSRKDVLDITFDIKLPPTQCSERSRSNPKKAKRLNDTKEKTITIVLAQDKTALRTRKGDTGSVLWKASIDFSQLILNQMYSTPDKSIFDPEKLRELHVLELGSGTGLLSIVFSPLVGRFTATDVGELVPLIRKNLALNFVGWPNCVKEQGNNVTVEELDWITFSSATPFLRKRMSNFQPVDILLVVDCIYHPSLLPHLVESLDHLAVSDRTVVVIVVELRAEDVIREFLTLWLQRSGWKIWRIGNNVFSMPYVAWVGHKFST
ncbi:putative methyltransferase domain containing protein [Amanita muscaria]